MYSLRKQRSFRDVINGSQPNDDWGASAEIPYWIDDVSLTRPGWCSWLVKANFPRPIKTTTHIEVVTCCQYGISALLPQTSVHEENICSVAKSRLFFLRLVLTKNNIKFRIFFPNGMERINPAIGISPIESPCYIFFVRSPEFRFLYM